MNATRSLGAVTAGIVAMSLVAAAFPSVASAANQAGDSCKKAGITLYNGELLCTKKGKRLIWVKSQVGITSNANIPKVIQNWGLAVDTYDSGSGMAGVLRIRGVTPPTFGNAADNAMYRHIFGVYGMDLKGTGMKEPQIAIIAPLGTQVVELGPVNASIHKVDENTSVAELEELTQMYRGLLERLVSSSVSSLTFLRTLMTS